MTAVRLMRREGDAWREVASEPLEGAAMDDRLKALVKPAVGEVDVFLPRDQILYTEVEIADLSNAQVEIEMAMDGRTPYALRDMRLDWNIDDDGTAQVAAIAHETLQEAASFVRDLGRTPAAFGALAEPKDFPRNPSFGRLEAPAPLVLTEDDTPAPTFVSARASSEPRTESDPVVRVDDATPVMSLDTPVAPPLDPGIPIALPNGPPRVRTDVGAAVARSRAQSLTAPAPVRVRQRDRALPSVMLAGVAAALCLGIAVIIWSIFPNSTGTLPQPPADTVSQDTTGALQPEQQADAPPALSDTPPATPVTELALAAPEPSVQPEAPSSLTGVPNKIAPELDLSALTAAPDLVPSLGEARDPRPETLTGIEESAPETFRLAALPATPAAPTALIPGELTYPGAAITTPLADTSDVTPDTTLPETIAALPPAIADSDTEVAVAPEPVEPVEEEVAEASEEGITPEAEVADATEEAPAPADAAETEIAALPTPEETPAPEATDPIADPEVAALPEPEVAPVPTAPIMTPTELAQSVPETAPRARPGDFSSRAERQQYNGYTLAELAERTPPPRPDSEQVQALLERASRAASELAVANSSTPRGKPSDFDTIVANALVQQQAERRSAALAANTPDTTAAIEAALAEEVEDEEATSPRNSPRLSIPSSASVARQATIDDAIRLNRINLIGVYGSPSDRRALLRLSSGRFVKVKIGDRLDGGTVSAISSSQLQYQKGSRTLSLTVPEG